MSTPLEELFLQTRKDNRAALIAYLPAGFPSIEGCKKAITVLAKAGIDAIEIGFPYSDPVMDGPTIQAAATIALAAGTGSAELFSTVEFAHQSGLPVVVMTYWNPIERYGVGEFTQALKLAGGSGVITPDLTIEESTQWQREISEAELNSIYVVAPSTQPARLAAVSAQCSGFIYAASLMGVTGVRAGISTGAQDLVERIRATSDLPIAVGLGVSTGEQARQVAGYADGVIVGSALIKVLLDAPDEARGLAALAALADELVAGVRAGR